MTAEPFLTKLNQRRPGERERGARGGEKHLRFYLNEEPLKRAASWRGESERELFLWNGLTKRPSRRPGDYSLLTREGFETIRETACVCRYALKVAFKSSITDLPPALLYIISSKLGLFKLFCDMNSSWCQILFLLLPAMQACIIPLFASLLLSWQWEPS